MKKEDVGILTSIGINVDFINRVEQTCEKATNNIADRILGLNDNVKAEG